MTDDLINRLTGELKPVSRHAMQRLLLGHALLGMVAGVVIMLAFLGARHDLAAAMAPPPSGASFAMPRCCLPSCFLPCSRCRGLCGKTCPGPRCCSFFLPWCGGYLSMGGSLA